MTTESPHTVKVYGAVKNMNYGYNNGRSYSMEMEVSKNKEAVELFVVLMFCCLLLGASR
jgi:lipoprotein signal peptidase